MSEPHKPFIGIFGKAISENDWQHFFGNEGRWKNTEHPQDHGESPTVSTIVQCHIGACDERPEPKHGFYYVIASVRGFHGKGFMPKFYDYTRSWTGNGDVHYGTSDGFYDSACAEGRRVVDKMAEKRSEWLKEIEKQMAEKHSEWLKEIEKQRADC